MQNAESQLETGWSAIHQIQEQSSVLDTLKNDLQSALNGSSKEDLEKHLQNAEVDFESTQLEIRCPFGRP